MNTARAGTLRQLLFAGLLAWAGGTAAAVPIPDELLQAVRGGIEARVIIEIDARAVDDTAARRRAALPRGMDDADALQALADGYRRRKGAVLGSLASADADTLIDYSHLPLLVRRVRSEAALRALAARPGVRALHADRLHQPVLAQSLPLIGQPIAATAGLDGAGATIAVIDNGIDLAQVGCSGVGVPASCRIAAAQSFIAVPSASNAHGTNVAAIVLGLAPAARVASLDVFTEAGALSTDVITAINWAIANRVALNIVAINLSLADTSHHTTACSGDVFATPIGNARNAGLSVVAAAGNQAYVGGVFTLGVSAPACAPGALSVGAVYDASLGGVGWSSCTDNATAADQVACFSNTASFLSLLAPGAVITAGGATLGGTSQASPHVAGALAVLRAAFPTETRAAIESRLIANGRPLNDPRTGQLSPRLDLRASARPANDDFANALVASGSSGSAAGNNRLATHEAAEPQAAAGATQSVWWRWTAPAAGQVSLDTLGSAFDTRLDVYTGNTVGSLVRVAGNDNADGSMVNSALHFQAVAGTTYRWAIDSSDGGSGATALNWALNTAATANVSVSLSGPANAAPGSVVAFTLTVSNAGPNAATGVVATAALPAGLSVVTVPAACNALATSIVCNAGELVSGAARSFALSLHVDSLTAPVTLLANVITDLPDPVAANNSASSVLAAGGDADIPTMPTWAALLLAALLLTQSTAIRRSR